MHYAIEEAEDSLREGNSGFGAVISRDGGIVARAHDTDTTDGDPTAHAEIKAIRTVSARFGKDLSGCILVATHEPCPMCSTAAVWAGIGEVAFGYTIREAIGQGRRRINLPLRHVFDLAGKDVTIHEPVLHEQCSVLYDKAVREDVKMLRNADEAALLKLAGEKCAKRLQWFKEHYSKGMKRTDSVIDDAYTLFLARLGITAEDAPVVRRSENRIVIHSRNFCPTLEACRILKMDTRFVCRHLTEMPTTELIRKIHPKLVFRRNYDMLRPHAQVCEEMIVLEP
jgi:tRNA(Arg) A34 adenosine deaminase TadA